LLLPPEMTKGCIHVGHVVGGVHIRECTDGECDGFTKEVKWQNGKTVNVWTFPFG